ncbi:hypothetical protein [Microseira sp. BLCC-F43]|uniref:hypothetical protein n=1 Tax=Microseira sp. BLCC-F43 TaxID=3153602 RepID=UPI0035BC0398
MKKTPTHYSEMLDHLSPNLETGFGAYISRFKATIFHRNPEYERQSYFHQLVRFCPQSGVSRQLLGFMRYMAVNLDTKQAALVLAPEGYRFEAVCHQP